MVQARPVERMVRRPDPHGGRDVGVLADLRIRDVAEAVAVGVVAEGRMRDPRVRPDLDIPARTASVSVQPSWIVGSSVRRGIGGPPQCPPSVPLMSLRRKMPDSQSIAMTMRMMSTM